MRRQRDARRRRGGVAQRCDGLAIRHFTSRVFQPAIAEFTILEKGDDMRHTFFDFHVPFTGRAVVEGNRLSGPGSDNPFTLGPGVEVARGSEDAPTASGRAASRAPAPPSLPQPCKER